MYHWNREQKTAVKIKKARDMCLCMCVSIGEWNGQLMLTESDREDRTPGFVFSADPNTESILILPARYGVSE